MNPGGQLHSLVNTSSILGLSGLHPVYCIIENSRFIYAVSSAFFPVEDSIKYLVSFV